MAVHGLSGDAIDTWTHPKSKAFWLKDFLPQQIPDARIMTFGQSTAEVIDHAKRLLSSLVEKREEPEVQNNGEPGSEEDIDTGLGDSTSTDIHCTLPVRPIWETQKYY